METNNQFKIVVLEDNDFYNQLLTRQLENYTSEIAQDKGYSFDISSYTNATDFLKNFKPDTDIAFVDYYLGESKNGLEVLKIIKQKCPKCKVVVISRENNIKTSFETLNEGAYTFIYKDQGALIESCVLVEEVIKDRLNPLV
ncbi:MAG: response regulator [Burkholderiales bacterium]|nr:response regulator [Bacteroidia bacterium]